MLYASQVSALHVRCSTVKLAIIDLHNWNVCNVNNINLRNLSSKQDHVMAQTFLATLKWWQQK